MQAVGQQCRGGGGEAGLRGGDEGDVGEGEGCAVGCVIKGQRAWSCAGCGQRKGDSALEGAGNEGSGGDQVAAAAYLQADGAFGYGQTRAVPQCTADGDRVYAVGNGHGGGDDDGGGEQVHGACFDDGEGDGQGEPRHSGVVAEDVQRGGVCAADQVLGVEGEGEGGAGEWGQ